MNILKFLQQENLWLKKENELCLKINILLQEGVEDKTKCAEYLKLLLRIKNKYPEVFWKCITLEDLERIRTNKIFLSK